MNILNAPDIINGVIASLTAAAILAALPATRSHCQLLYRQLKRWFRDW